MPNDVCMQATTHVCTLDCTLVSANMHLAHVYMHVGTSVHLCTTPEHETAHRCTEWEVCSQGVHAREVAQTLGYLATKLVTCKHAAQHPTELTELYIQEQGAKLGAAYVLRYV